MDRWCRDFDNWAICDTVCFHLFDRTNHAWVKVEQWAAQPDEFVKRAAFALLWGLARHDRDADDDQFAAGLALIEREAIDERPLVRKSVSMALRSIGKRNAALNAAAQAVAERLSEAPSGSARWVGRAALRDLAPNSPRRDPDPAPPTTTRRTPR
jgi:3-methyladenine DNA glycosylase AlkD